MPKPVSDLPLTPDLIAPCGIDCRLCRAYTRERNRCPGCRYEGPNKPISCTNCRIKQGCERLTNEQVAFCFECSSFPCDPVKHLDWRYRTRYTTSPIENLRSIQSVGLEAFVMFERVKWTCPNCGAIRSMHNLDCAVCGADWRH